MNALTTIAAVLLSYLLGAVPAGLLLGLWLRGIDVRQHGSRNIGATNTLRVLGKKLGAAALVFDVGKGLVPVLVFARLSHWPYAALACGIAAIAGHLAPIYLRFHGGKGVATSAGVFLALCPPLVLAGLAAFVLILSLTRIVSVSSISAALVMIIAVYVVPHAWATFPTRLLPEGPALRMVVTLVALVVIWKHRSNIQRLLKGRENRL